MQQHKILAQHKRTVAHEKAKAEAARQRDAQLADLEAANNAYQASCRSAFAASKPAPAPPTDIGNGPSVMAGYQATIEALDADYAEWLRAECPALDAAVVSKADDLLANVSTALAVIEAACEELGELAATQANLRRMCGLGHGLVETKLAQFDSVVARARAGEPLLTPLGGGSAAAA